MNTNLDDEATFKGAVAATLSNDLTKIIDRAITSKNLTYTQKRLIENFRDRGLIDAIIIGNFKQVTIDDVIELLAVFKLGFSVHTVTKYEYEHSQPLTTRH